MNGRPQRRSGGSEAIVPSGEQRVEVNGTGAGSMGEQASKNHCALEVELIYAQRCCFHCMFEIYQFIATLIGRKQLDGLDGQADKEHPPDEPPGIEPPQPGEPDVRCRLRTWSSHRIREEVHPAACGCEVFDGFRLESRRGFRRVSPTTGDRRPKQFQHGRLESLLCICPDAPNSPWSLKT